MDKQNIEIINEIPVDWDKFKGKAKKSRKPYIGLCELLYKNNHKLLSEYIDARTKVLIDFGCGHEPHWITPYRYKRGQGCARCVGKGGQSKEDFLNMLEENSHKLMSEYKNNSIKVKIDYNCGHEPHWILPSAYKQGQGCPRCVGLCSEQAKENFIEMINNNGHKLLSDYKNAKTKVLIDFNCGHEPHWMTLDCYKRGHGCPRCSGNCPEQAKERFISILNKNGHKLLGEYIGAKTKVLIDFNCEHEPHWITPSNYKNGCRCPKCSNKCPEQAKKDLIDLISKNGHILLSEYIGVTTKVLIDFNCGHEPYWMTPKNYKNGHECPKCVGNCPEQAKEDFIDLIRINNHKLLSEYINNNTKTLIAFNCGHEPHWIRPSDYKSGRGCPLCKNKGESALYQLLLDMRYEVEIQKKYPDLKDKSLLPYDFYLSEYNLLIELDGEHHRKPMPYITKDMTQQERDMEELDAEKRFYDRQRKDKMKDDYAKNNNIPLLRIEYYDGKIELDKWKELILNKIKEIEVKRELIAL